MTNLVILVGRIARDPETRTTQGGTSITSISVVTDRPARKDGKTYKDENGYTAKDSEFHRITCFNGLGQNVAKYCTKGQLVTVEGRIHYTQWEDQSGAKRYGCEIIADKVDFLTKGRSGSNEGAPDIDEDGMPSPYDKAPVADAIGAFSFVRRRCGGQEHRTPCRRRVELRGSYPLQRFLDPDCQCSSDDLTQLRWFDRLGAALDQHPAEFDCCLLAETRLLVFELGTLFTQLLQRIARSGFGPGHRVSFLLAVGPLR